MRICIRRRDEKGFAIAIVLLFAMFMMMFALTLMHTARQTQGQGLKLAKKIRAVWMARSGVQLTLMKIKELREEFYDALKWSGNGKSSYKGGKPGPADKLLPSAHAIEREFHVMSALAGRGVPVARMHVLCEDEAVIGRAFYVMECVDGRVLWDQSLPGLSTARA